jgi:hypothetical protein
MEAVGLLFSKHYQGEDITECDIGGNVACIEVIISVYTYVLVTYIEGK